MATVLDSRVICVRPELENPKVRFDGYLSSNGYDQERFALVSSVISAPTAPHDGLRGWTYGCPVDPFKSSHSVWRITLCQIMPYGFHLPSQFERSSRFFRSGLTYLVLNVTSGSEEEWLTFINPDRIYTIPTYNERRPVRNESNGEWLDLVFTENGTMRISVSVCSAASDTEDLFIHAYSSMNRTGPLTEFDDSKSKYRYDKVRRQLGQTNDGSWTHGMSEGRGILQLQPRPSWQAGTHQGDYNRSSPFSWEYISWVNDAARFESSSLTFYSNSMDRWPPRVNVTAYLSTEKNGVFREGYCQSAYNFSSIYPDPSFSSLLQDILHHGGDIAHGLSSLITVQAGLTYYDQLLQFNGRSDAEQTFFELVLTPQRYRGYIAVVTVASVHLILVTMVLFQFLICTEISTVGNAWQTLAQIKDPLTDELLDLHTLSSDSEVNLWMKTKDAHVKAMDRLSEGLMNASSNENTTQDLPSTLRPSDVVGIRLARSGFRTELARRDQLSRHTD